MRQPEAEAMAAARVYGDVDVVAQTAEVPLQNRMGEYSESLPRMDSMEDDEVYPWQPTAIDADQGSERSRSPPRAQRYGGTDGPGYHAYKSGDAEVYVVDDGQIDRGFRPPSPIGGDLDAYDEFDFLFPTSDSKEDELSELEYPAVESDSPHREDRDGQGKSNAKKIYSSRYTGSAELGGAHAAQMTELFDTKGKQRPLFKWL
jgi:hypothetical protein